MAQGPLVELDATGALSQLNALKLLAHNRDEAQSQRQHRAYIRHGHAQVRKRRHEPDAGVAKLRRRGRCRDAQRKAQQGNNAKDRQKPSYAARGIKRHRPRQRHGTRAIA